MAIFRNLPTWKEYAYLYMATDDTVKGLSYIIPEEILGFEVPTIKSPDAVLFRTREHLTRAKGLLEKVIYGEKPIKKIAEEIRVKTK